MEPILSEFRSLVLGGNYFFWQACACRVAKEGYTAGNLSLSNNHYEATILHTVLGAKDPLAERIKSCNLEEMDFPQY